MALFPSVIPWTLFFLTQVNDSWLSSGVPGRWATPVQKNACRLQVLAEWERARKEWGKGGLGWTKKSGLTPPVGSLWLLEEAEGEEKSLCTGQKKEGDTVLNREAPQFSSCRRALSLSPWQHTHSHSSTHTGPRPARWQVGSGDEGSEWVTS